jgi:hypothetical protein
LATLQPGGAAKALATKFLQIFHGNYFGFPAGNLIFATRSKFRLPWGSKVRLSPGKVRPSPGGR